MLNEESLRVATSQYGRCMWEIRERIDFAGRVYNAAANNESIAKYPILDVETIFLNFRKILELSMFASAAAFGEFGERLREKIVNKEWNAWKIFSELEKKNPKFYPVPLDTSSRYDWQELRGGFLAREEFQHLYNRCCGPLMHAERDYLKAGGEEISLSDTLEWLNKISKLFEFHLVDLTEDLRLCVTLRLRGSDGVEVAPFTRDRGDF